MLALAIVTTTLTVVGAQWFVWNLYDGFFERVRDVGEVATTSSEPPLVVGLGKAPGGATEWIAYTTAFAELQRDLGKPVNLRYATSTQDLFDGVATKEIDVALVPTLAYLDLEESGLATAIVAPKISGEATESAVMVVAAGSPAQRFEDLEGKRLALASDTLADGYARWLAGTHGVTVATFFSSVDEEGTEESNLTEVAKGEADATFVESSALAARESAEFRVIERSPAFGTPPIVVRVGLDSDLTDRVSESLCSIDETALPPASELSGFSPVDDTDYDFARKLRELVHTSNDGSPEVKDE